MKFPKPIRWGGEEDKYFGPFTFHRNRSNEFGFNVRFGDGRDCPQSYIRLHFGKLTVLFPIPSIVKPWKMWIDTSKFAWSDNPAGGYWEFGYHDYGVVFSRTEMHWKFGPQSFLGFGGSNRSGCWFYPWCDTTLLSCTYTDLDGNRCESNEDDKPVAVFLVHDFDGEVIEAKVAIEHSKYRVGRGLWHWLLLGKTRNHTSLEIKFASETGRRKGSWKGGTTGVWMPANSADTAATAMRKYCEENDMKLIGVRGVVS
jgi:hypothetical protein